MEHGGVEIRVAHQFLNGSNNLLALLQMGCERMAEGVANCRSGEADALNGFHYSLLNQARIPRVIALGTGFHILRAVLLNAVPQPANLKQRHHPLRVCTNDLVGSEEEFAERGSQQLGEWAGYKE